MTEESENSVRRQMRMKKRQRGHLFFQIECSQIDVSMSSVVSEEVKDGK